MKKILYILYACISLYANDNNLYTLLNLANQYSEAEINSNSSGKQYIKGLKENHKFFITMKECDDFLSNTNCKFVKLFVRYTNDFGFIEQDDLNHWNANTLYGNAYFSKANNIEMKIVTYVNHDIELRNYNASFPSYLDKISEFRNYLQLVANKKIQLLSNSK